MDLSTFQELHLPCEGDNPSGANLEYSDPFLEMMRLSESRPEVQYGSTILPAREPDWNRLVDCCLTVANSTRDLRVAVLLVEGLCRTQRWSGLANGMELLDHWITEYWDCIHPRFDEADGEDPTERLGVLSRLVTDELLLQSIALVPLSEHRSLGRITLRDYNSIFLTPNSTTNAKLSPIEAEIIFREMDQGEYEVNLRDIERTKRAFASMDRFLLEKVGTEKWSGSRLTQSLDQIHQILLKHAFVPIPAPVKELPESHSIEPLSSQNLDQTKLPEMEPAVCESPATEEPHGATPRQQTWNKATIASRTEATIAIDSICSYFEQHEPASPVPLILQRAKRLIPMSFVEIIRELAPNEGHEFLQHLVCSK